MTKEEKPVFFKVLIVVGIVLIINVTIFSFKLNVDKGLTGLSITEKIATSYSKISLASKVFLLVQWIALILLLLGVSIKDRRLRKRGKEDELKGIDLRKMSEGNGTDIDTLYNILKEKKELKLSSIMRLFKVKKEVALGWCRTLESGNLAVINYAPKDHVIKIIEENQNG